MGCSSPERITAVMQREREAERSYEAESERRKQLAKERPKEYKDRDDYR